MTEEIRRGGIVTGTIENLGTGELKNFRRYLLFTDFEFTTIAKIERVESYELPDDSFQVSVDCKGLDTIGSVYALGLNFATESAKERDQILNDLKVDSIFIVKGGYTICDSELPHICLHNPYYEPVYSQFSEKEIREAFDVNGP